MPNDLSNAFHADLKQVEALFLKELAKLESGLETLLSDVRAVVTDALNNAGPIIVAAAAAGVQAAFAAGVTGGLGALASAGEQAALAVIESQGLKLAEEEWLKLRTLVLGNVLKSNSSPVAAPSGNTVTGG